MAYTTYTEVQSDFKKLTFATGSGNVTQEDVTQFIVESDALIDSYVGAVYQTPVASGAGLNLLKLFSRSLTTARIKRIMEVKQEKNTDANQNVVGVLLSPSAVMKQLEQIRDKQIKLDGAIPLSSSTFYSNNAANSIAPVIKKDERQW